MTQAPSIKEALKPCPFCNGEALLLHGGPGNWFVQCTQCKCTTNDEECSSRSCKEPAFAFNDDGEALCKDCLMEWSMKYAEDSWS